VSFQTKRKKIYTGILYLTQKINSKIFGLFFVKCLETI